MSQMSQRVLHIAPHFPEYSWRLSTAMGGICGTHLAVDRTQFDLEFEHRAALGEAETATTKVGFESLFSILTLLLLVVRFRPTIIHVQEPAGLKKSLICLIVLLLCSPFSMVALTVHDPMPHSGRDKAIARRTWPLRRVIRAISRLIFVHGEHCRAEYTERHPSATQAILSVNHGAILDDLKERRPASEVLTALFFGRMEEYKGLNTLLAALHSLRAKGEYIRLTIAGAGPELDRLQSEFKEFSDVTIVNKFIKPLQLMTMLKDSDCVLMPYEGATQSGVLAAAMGNGRFVIASEVGGIPDIVSEGGNGLLMRPKDADSLTHCLLRVAQEPELKARLLAGAELTGRTTLSWDRIARETFNGYLHAICGRRSSDAAACSEHQVS